jgi:hypothetical protein
MLHHLQGGFQTLLKYIKENDPDKLSIALASSLDIVAELELLQVLSEPIDCWIEFRQCLEQGIRFQ